MTPKRRSSARLKAQGSRPKMPRLLAVMQAQMRDPQHVMIPQVRTPEGGGGGGAS